MIEINLLPEELKAKTRGIASLSAKGGQPDFKKFLYFIPAGLAVLFILQISLAGITLAKNSHLASLNQRWMKLEPERKRIESFQKESAVSSAENQNMQQLLSKRVLWSEKLNALSADLPSGIWFEEIILEGAKFSLRATVISLRKEEMSLINKFIDSLKKDSRFFGDFEKLELVSVARRQMQSYEVNDFILSGNLKNK